MPGGGCACLGEGGGPCPGLGACLVERAFLCQRGGGEDTKGPCTRGVRGRMEERPGVCEDARTKGMLGVIECSLWELAVNASRISVSFRDQTTPHICMSAFCLVRASFAQE